MYIAWACFHDVTYSLFHYRFIASDAIEDEDGDYKSKEDREHRTVSETEKNRVTWNTERRSYLEGSAAKKLVFLVKLHSVLLDFRFKECNFHYCIKLDLVGRWI